MPAKDNAASGKNAVSPDRDKDKPLADSWNERPRDLYNLSHWLGTNLEAPLRWNIVTLATPPAELRKAPVLYIAGATAPVLSDADISKLRQFVEEGGLLLANADCGSKPFADAIKELGAKMFPQYEFRELSANHVIYTGEQYPADKWKSAPKLLGLGNGVRNW